MTQKEQVVTAMRKNGGYANFQQQNQTIDLTSWGDENATSVRKTYCSDKRRIFSHNVRTLGIKRSKAGNIEKT